MPSTEEPTVDTVIRFEDLPLGSRGDRAAVVKWSDGTEGVALAWYSDEVLICEGDLIGKTLAEVRGVLGHRDREYLRS